MPHLDQRESFCERRPDVIFDTPSTDTVPDRNVCNRDRAEDVVHFDGLHWNAFHGLQNSAGMLCVLARKAGRVGRMSVIKFVFYIVMSG